MFKELFLRKMLKDKLSAVPEADRERLIQAVLKNPDLFTKIAQEIQSKMGSGKDQMSAAKEVMEKYKDELGGILTK